MAKYSEVFAARCLEVNQDHPKSKGAWRNIGTAFRGTSEKNGSDYFTILLNKDVLPLSIDQIHLFPLSAAQKALRLNKKLEEK